MRLFKKMGIRQKFQLILGISFFLIGLFLFFYFPQKQKSEMTDSVMQKARVIAQMVAKNSEAGLMFDDASSVDTQLEAFKEMSDVEFAIVLKKDGSKFAAYQEKKYTSRAKTISELINNKVDYQLDGNIAYGLYQVGSGKDISGHVVIAISTVHIDSLASAAQTTALIISALIFVLGLGGMRVFFNKVIYQPIKDLETASNKVASGDLNVAMNINSQDEIGSLSKSFSYMVDQVKLQIENLNNLPTPVMQVDKDFNIQFMNKFGAGLVGSDPKSLLGKKCYDYFKTEHCKTEKCSCFQAIKFDKVVTEETISKANGQNLNIMYTGSPVKDKNGEIIGALEYVADISEIKQMQNYLKQSTDKMLSAVSKFAEGDLNVEVVPERNDDSIGKLFIGFNTAIAKVKAIMSNVVETIQAVASASNQISASAEEMAAGSHEQSAQTNEVASAVEQMTSTILQTTKNASSAAEFSKKAGGSAKNGGDVVKQTVEGMNRIANVVSDAASTVKELGTSSNQIGEIIQVINDIADQTNLLALNAAIEAARAGEQGRGFAVVADEVRKLAERTTKATKEIAAMIKQIQNDTGNAVESIESGTKEVVIGKELANKAIIALDEIIGSTNETIDVVNQVAAASEEQSSAAEQISKSIEGISNVTRESSAGIQQIARASEDLSNLTTNLQNLVSAFKINSNNSSKDHSQLSVRANGKMTYS